MKTRTAFLTLPLQNNYGGILQAIALYEAIGLCGHDAVWLDKSVQITSVKAFLAELLRKLPGHDIRFLRSRGVAARKHREWIEKRMPSRSRRAATSRQLGMEAERLGVANVIVGSDQVWRIDFQGDGNENNYFLDFGPESMGRLSYAASFGHENWIYSERTSKISELLKRFRFVSVREKSGQTICRDAFSCADAQLVLDPTLLHDAPFYEKMIAEGHVARAAKPAGIVVYALDHMAKAVELAWEISVRKGGLDIKFMTLRSREYVSVTEWLGSFAAADFIITDSYHGTIFAIMFRKPFISLANMNRGLDRFETLLGILGLRHRLLHDLSQSPDYNELADLDYSGIEEPLAQARQASLALLKSALDNQGA